MKEKRYLPEGYAPPDSRKLSLSDIQRAAENGDIFEGLVTRCDRHQNLTVRFAGYEGVIPAKEAVLECISGAEREIARLSLVGSRVCFVIETLRSDGGGKPTLLLSRKKAQQEAMEHLLELPCGSIVRGKITHLAPFGAFVDIGCGVIALLPLELISVGRINHPSLRFCRGDKILAALWRIDPDTKRFTLTHRELLGTWMENASLFAPGETVTGYVRSIKDYGIFVELTPNLSGLADYRSDVLENDAVSVYIKSIRSEQMKIKLQLLHKIPSPPSPEPSRYFITDGILSRWRYAPQGCTKVWQDTVFTS